jgi:ADP-ribose pyrophosphatase YjhB (NUDIX family)
VLRLIPPGVHRAGLRLAHALRRRWWRLARPTLEGVSIAAFDGEGHVLLVRHSYGTGRWALPGGGVRKGEDPQAAAGREFAEELGVAVTGLVPVAVMDEDLHGALNRVHLFAGKLTANPHPDGREVVAAQFFSLDALPEPRSATVSARLALLQQR